MAKPKKSTTRTPPKPAAPVAGGAPLIDPSQSAAAAAAMIVHKVPTSVVTGTPTQSSSSFRNLKESLNKPSSQAIGNLLDKSSSAGSKKNAPMTGGPSQLRHNQVFGADVNRRSVPRRTGG